LARFRLRFLLQEFDLAGNEVVIGRSPECQITIEDPLISRRHARLTIVGGDAFVEDLGSRNGVRVNGELIDGRVALADGDRIRLGTQELVLFTLDQGQRASRTTGFMRVCSGCGTPYPEQAPQCPHCGADDVEEETMSGMSVEPEQNWTFQLLGEVIERALSSGRALEADRILGRAAREVDRRIAAGDILSPEHLDVVAGFALRLATMTGELEWARWALALYREQHVLPSAEFMDSLEGLDRSAIAGLPELLVDFTAWARQLEGADREGLERLSRITAPG